MSAGATPPTTALSAATVLVLGLGDSGLAMAHWCARAGARVRVWDSRAEPPQAAALAERVPAAQRLAPDPLLAADLAGIDRVLRSPGLAPHDAHIAALLAAAAAAGVPVQAELDLFREALDALRSETGYAPRLIAVTGTNGKTTTTAMTALLVAASGRRVAKAGNIGPTLLGTLADAIDAGPRETVGDRLPEVWVLELSSFQLAGAAGFEADAAALLNLSEDHLDWHGSMAAYGAAKARVFGQRAAIVVNRDDAAAMRLLPAPAPVASAGKRERRAPGRPQPGRPPQAQGGPVPAGSETIERRVSRAVRVVIGFGSDAPRKPGDWGLVVENDMAWLVRARDDDVPPGKGEPPGAPTLQRLMPADALRVRGRHNALNALAALALALAIGCPLAPMLHALREYRGEPHRVEYVATVGGVDAFDDSKGTNVGATVAAIDGLGADRAPARLVVILGGDGKGQDFAPLAAPLTRHARAALTIGRDAQRVERALAGTGVAFERCATLEQAVPLAFARAEPGDAVLLSPACASLDMFRNYEHRAQVFVAAVKALAVPAGGVTA